MFNSVKEVQEFIKENRIEMVDFKMVDLEGRWRHLSIPVERFTEKQARPLEWVAISFSNA